MKHGIFRIFKVMKFSYSGLKYLWKEEAFRQEVVLVAIAFGVLYYMGASCQDLAIFGGLSLAMFSAEAMNTGLERIADKIDSSINPFTKEVKDLGAVGVFFWIILTVGWALYVLSKLI
ncbi:MAG: diacylglycerol kinase [Alphaproteobacteria bacterium]